MKKLKQTTEIISVTARNLILGGNLISLALVRHPKKLIAYVSESLFLYRALHKKRGVPQKNIFEVLPSKDLQNVTLGNLCNISWRSDRT